MRTLCSILLLLPLAGHAQPPSSGAPQGDASATQVAPEPAPQPSAKATSLPLDSGEPFGLALKGGVDRYRLTGETQEIRKARIEWGMQQSEVSEMLKPPSGSKAYEADKGLSCFSQKNGASSCYPNVSAPWSADFGDSFQWSMDPYLQFTPDGKFYSYHLSFHGNAFDDTKQALLARLGKPKEGKTSTVENRMGAKFDQEIMAWKGSHTLVLLVKRSSSDLTKGLLQVTYTPLEKTLPPEPTGAAPF